MLGLGSECPITFIFLKNTFYWVKATMMLVQKVPTVNTQSMSQCCINVLDVAMQ